MTAILPATANDNIDVVGEWVAGIIFDDNRREPVPLQSLLQYEDIPVVPLNIHVARVKLQDSNAPLIHTPIPLTFV